jgi:nucleoside-diphosphate-sugar epimerase
MKILLFGSKGQVGWQLRRSLAPLGQVVCLDSKGQDFCGDLLDTGGIARTVQTLQPHVVVNAAAYTAVDKAEDESDLAFAVNARACEALAKASAETGAWLVHYSTDYVYDGSGERPLTGSDGLPLTYARWPSWSPDGSELALYSVNTTREAIMVANADGSGLREVARRQPANFEEFLGGPDWSPDGQTIVFTAMMGGFEICTVPAQGGNAEQLTRGADPCWAPNSRTIIFARRQGGRRVLSLLDVPTKQSKDVSRISGSNSQPSWAR